MGKNLDIWIWTHFPQIIATKCDAYKSIYDAFVWYGSITGLIACMFLHNNDPMHKACSMKTWKPSGFLIRDFGMNWTINCTIITSLVGNRQKIEKVAEPGLSAYLNAHGCDGHVSTTVWPYSRDHTGKILTMLMKPGLLSKPARSTPPIPPVCSREDRNSEFNSFCISQ